MGARRSLGRLLAVVAAFVAVCVAGAATPRVGAERQSTIVFAGQPSGVIVFSSGGGGGQEIQLNFLPALAPLPQKVPAGYKLDLTNAPGTTIADAAISVIGVDSPSFATGFGPEFHLQSAL